MEDERKFLEEHSDEKFVAMIKVGRKGVKNFFIDKRQFFRFREEAWDSGHDLEVKILKDEN